LCLNLFCLCIISNLDNFVYRLTVQRVFDENIKGLLGMALFLKNVHLVAMNHQFVALEILAKFLFNWYFINNWANSIWFTIFCYKVQTKSLFSQRIWIYFCLKHWSNSFLLLVGYPPLFCFVYVLSTICIVSDLIRSVLRL
jgi:hypothetical protein